MSDPNGSNNDDFFYGILLALGFLLLFLPIILVKSAKEAPDKLAQVRWASSLRVLGIAVALTLGVEIALLVVPSLFEQTVFSVGRLHVRWVHVALWLAGNVASFGLCYGTLPYWQKWLRRETHLRTGLY
jgi:hypothetical protein